MKFASAPGKVLLSGGYLILDQPYSGLVLSTSARFFASAVALRDDGPENDVRCHTTTVEEYVFYFLSVANVLKFG